MLFNEYENLDDINNYQIYVFIDFPKCHSMNMKIWTIPIITKLLLSYRLAEASFNEYENLDDINVY